MTHAFDAGYWEDHWQQAGDHPGAAHPYLAMETAGLTPGSAIDAGCGRGAEALWLAEHGWQVTGVDISPTALAYAAARAQASGVAGEVEWVAADLGTWEPKRRFDLVVTSYAHPAMAQLAFYQRVSAWVAPGGTLLVVGHLHGQHGHLHGHLHGCDEGHGQKDGPPVEATVTSSDVTALLEGPEWQVVTAAERRRDAGGRVWHDVVVRARRLR